MLDPKNIAEKAAIMEKAQMKPEDYLGGRTEEQVQADLVEMFDKFDADNSGELDAEEFEACMKSMELGLSKGQIGALMATADTSGDGTIDKVRARLLLTTLASSSYYYSYYAPLPPLLISSRTTTI